MFSRLERRTPLSTDPKALSDETTRRGQALLRTLPILLLPFLAAVLMGLAIHFLLGNPFPQRPANAPNVNPLVPILVIGIFLTAIVALVRLGRPNISSILLIGVWTLITTLVGLRSDTNQIWPALLIVPICAAGLLLDGAASIALAGLASVLVVGVEWVTFQLGVPLSPLLPLSNPALTPLLTAGFWVGLYWTVAALTYLLSNSLQHALASSRAQAAALSELTASLEARVQAQTAALVQQSSETAVMEERSRVARDIHDTLAQGLTGIVVQLGAAQRALQVEPGDVEGETAALEHVTLAQGLAREALAEARRSIWNLRAPSLEHGELRDALAGLATRASNATTQVQFELQGEPWALHADVESALLRVAQEALVNMDKHAAATRATVTLDYMPTAVRLVIHDNGVGLADDALHATNAVKGPESGFGLMGMRERIQQWGGTLTLTNEGGAKVEAVIPRTRAARSPGATAPEKVAP